MLCGAFHVVNGAPEQLADSNTFNVLTPIGQPPHEIPTVSVLGAKGTQLEYSFGRGPGAGSPAQVLESKLPIHP